MPFSSLHLKFTCVVDPVEVDMHAHKVDLCIQCTVVNTNRPIPNPTSSSILPGDIHPHSFPCICVLPLLIPASAGFPFPAVWELSLFFHYSTTCCCVPLNLPRLIVPQSFGQGHLAFSRAVEAVVQASGHLNLTAEAAMVRSHLEPRAWSSSKGWIRRREGKKHRTETEKK